MLSLHWPLKDCVFFLEILFYFLMLFTKNVIAFYKDYRMQWIYMFSTRPSVFIKMFWCFSTMASAAAVLSSHPCDSKCSWVNRQSYPCDKSNKKIARILWNLLIFKLTVVPRTKNFVGISYFTEQSGTWSFFKALDRIIIFVGETSIGIVPKTQK